MTETRQREREPSDPDAPTPKADRPRTQPGLVAEPARPVGAAPALAPAEPARRGLRLRRGVQEARRRGAASATSIELMTTSQDWWPADYGHYGAALHPHELARGRHVPHRRRPRRRRRGRAALRPAQQLARQRQPRQGAPAAVADQAEVRPARSRGPTCSSSPATSRWSRWASRRSGSASGARTSGSRRRSSGAPRTPGSATSATAATASSPGPLGAVQMGLIYVNPEGPNGNPDPLAAAHDIRETFARMAMNDEETVALIVGGHTFGKTPRRGQPRPTSARSPRAAPSSSRASAGRTASTAGNGADTITSGLEGAWTNEPDQVGQRLPREPLRYEWELTESPAGAKQWTPTNAEAQDTVPDAHDPSKRARADDADDGPRAAGRPDLRADREALPREPRPARRRLRQGLVQAAAPRHGAGVALPRPVGARSRSSGRTRSRRSTTS